ncbi:MAG: hypothetical protein GEU28_06365 [Dehalococcoidia bacterium]|nr:hypothetical protein [Dehalococcoidia bacterium]
MTLPGSRSFVRGGVVFMVIGLLAALAVVTACGDDDDDDDDDDEDETTVEAETEEATEEPPATEEATEEVTETPSATPEAEEGVIHVRAGLNDPEDITIAVLEYLPESITVAVDTTVRWELSSPEPHSVSFFPEGQQPPPPGDESVFGPTPPTGPFDGTAFVNSGLAPLGPEPVEFDVVFATPGTFSYLCVIHPLMTGTVTVVEDEAEADTQTDVDQRGDDELEQWLEDGRAAKADLVAQEPRSEANPDGTTTWYVEMGATTEHTDILAFAPVDAPVAVGDTVVFVNNSLAPHTATFANGNPIPPPVGPEVAMVVPGPSPQTLNTTDYFNTGLLPPNAPPGAGPPEAVRSFAFVVPEADQFVYLCILHVPSGMEGSITAE